MRDRLGLKRNTGNDGQPPFPLTTKDLDGIGHNAEIEGYGRVVLKTRREEIG